AGRAAPRVRPGFLHDLERVGAGARDRPAPGRELGRDDRSHERPGPGGDRHDYLPVMMDLRCTHPPFPTLLYFPTPRGSVILSERAARASEGRPPVVRRSPRLTPGASPG